MGIKEAEDKTISTIFLLRPLGFIGKDEKIETSVIKDFGFKQAYIADVFKAPLTRHPVYLLFKQEHFGVAFTEFIMEEYKRGFLKDDYDYPDGFTVLEYEFPKEYQEDYDKILRGKYSETSKEFQGLFPIQVEMNGLKRTSLYYRVFNKTEEMVIRIKNLIGEEYYQEGMEVYSSPYLDRETLDITKYTEWDEQ